MELLIVSVASFLAGLVDSIVGGGGLVLVPALFTSFPAAAPATLLGTNKCAGVLGTSIATVHYARRVRLRWPVLLPAALAAFVGSLAGAWSVTVVDPAMLRRLLPFVLLAVFFYTLARKNLGRVHAPRHSGATQALLACAAGSVVGWYDGFFGPGTGSFFIILFVRLLGYDFLNASASAKLLNVATNCAALLLFALKGYVWWRLGLGLAAANIAGSVVGSRLALRHGPVFVRRAFIVVVGVLILKTGYDAFIR